MVILTADALYYYSSNLKSKQSFEEVINGLKDWFKCDEQKKRFLREWHITKLKDRINLKKQSLEVGVFIEIASELSNIQK